MRLNKAVPPYAPNVMPSFTLLDDCDSTAHQPTSRLYTQLWQVLSCDGADQFAQVIEQMQSALQQGYYAVAVFSYELGAQLQGVNLSQLSATRHQQLSKILLYQQCQHLSQEQVSTWLSQQITSENNSNQVAGIADLHANINQEEFTRAVERIQRYIVDGDTYQVNYTFRFHFESYGHLGLLYQRLRERQSVPFGALIVLPDGSAILSLSPELFIRHSNGQLSAQPMKGTSAALMSSDAELNQQINQQRAVVLSTDPKNRAENVMIVDLLRNDLGRIAQPGSVQASPLFEVQQFNTILQMTSSITAQCRSGVTLIDMLKATFPCGSITGAPKIRTMQIIDEVETEARGFYTGAIGWFDPTPTTNNAPEFCLSVPIRTMYLQAPKNNGTRHAVMGVGAGIIFDSVPADEYQECLLKARFLTELPPQFSLFETMYATKENGCRYWDRHLARLLSSARYFGIPINVFDLNKQLELACAKLISNTPSRLKLSVNGVGQYQFQSAPLTLITAPVQVLLATAPQSSSNLWLQHKTTQRTDYDQAWQFAEQHGAFDMLFYNERGELTEGARSNILVKLDGCWYTPPLNAGVLPGVMRSVLMEDPAWGVTERNVPIDQLADVEEIVLCNALRGVLPAKLDGIDVGISIAKPLVWQP